MNSEEMARMLGLGNDLHADDASTQLESHLISIEDRLRELAHGDPLERGRVELERARTLVALGRGEEAWPVARPLVDLFVGAEEWELAVEACDALFLTEQPEALVALGNGLWLSITYPVDPELTVALLQHVVDETPPDSDGAAVAAAVAAWIVDLRAPEEAEDLRFFVQRLLGTVAQRHSQVESEEQFRFWVQKLELDEPDKFMVRMRNVVDVLVQDDWWFDREALQQALPVN